MKKSIVRVLALVLMLTLVITSSAAALKLQKNDKSDNVRRLQQALTQLGYYSGTVDGSFGKQGFVTDALPGDATYLYACGPMPMLKALYSKTELDGQFSFEARMGCGFGACMGCSCKTKYGNKRICKDGPVLEKEEIVW